MKERMMDTSRSFGVQIKSDCKQLIFMYYARIKQYLMLFQEAATNEIQAGRWSEFIVVQLYFECFNARIDLSSSLQYVYSSMRVHSRRCRQ